MSFNEPLLAILPADESTILEVATKGGKIHPDPILRRLRRLELFGAIKRRKDGKYSVTERKKDEPWSSTVGKRKNPVNHSQLKRRTCPECQTTYTGITRHFGDHHARVCKACIAKRPEGMHGNSKGKVCLRCGEYRYPLGKEFREYRKSGQKVWSGVCNRCWGGA